MTAPAVHLFSEQCGGRLDQPLANHPYDHGVYGPFGTTIYAGCAGRALVPQSKVSTKKCLRKSGTERGQKEEWGAGFG